MKNPPEVTVTRTTTTNDRTVLGVDGEIDHDTADRMYHDVLAMTDDGVLHLVLDFTAVGFCDSSGLSALLGIWRRLHANGGTLTVSDAPANVARAMRIGGMDRLIAVHLRTTGAEPNTTA